jgi:hypothetical protein
MMQIDAMPIATSERNHCGGQYLNEQVFVVE